MCSPLVNLVCFIILQNQLTTVHNSKSEVKVNTYILKTVTKRVNKIIHTMLFKIRNLAIFLIELEKSKIN